MVEKTKIDLEQNSPFRVALELANMIAKAEGKLDMEGGYKGDRKYWLDLYGECHRIVLHGRGLNLPKIKP